MKKLFSVILLGLIVFCLIVINPKEVNAWSVNYDSFETAYEGTINTSVIMYLNTNYDYDYLHYRVPSGKGGAYNMYTSYYSTYNLNTYGTLYEEQGMLWWHEYEYKTSNDNGGDGGNFRIQYDLNAAEDYFIKIRPDTSLASGGTRVYFEENVDKFSSENGAYWVANPTYSDTSYRYLTTEMVQLYYFANANPTLWEQVMDIVAIAGVDYLMSSTLSAILVAAVGIASLPADLIALATATVVTVIVSLFVPTLEERIQDACYGTISIDPNGVKTISCVYETRVTNEDWQNMERYTSSVYVGVTRERGVWYQQVN